MNLIMRVIYLIVKGENSACEKCKYHFVHSILKDCCFHHHYIQESHFNPITRRSHGLPTQCEYINTGFCWEYEYQKPDPICCENPVLHKARAILPIFPYAYCDNCRRGIARFGFIRTFIFRNFFAPFWDGHLMIQKYPEKPVENPDFNPENLTNNGED